MSISTDRLWYSLASPYKKHLILPSPICPRCQEALDSCNFREPFTSDIINTVDLPTPRVVENCFLCLQVLGLHLTEPADQAKYIEALRLNPQHFLGGVSQRWSLLHSAGLHVNSLVPYSSHYTRKEKPGVLWVYSIEELAGFESFVPVASSTGSDWSLDLSKQWLQNCNENHFSCSHKANKHPRFLPTRLVDIGTVESAITPRLRLRKDLPLDSAYFTLSHCWGKIMPETTLLQSTIESMLREINFSQLSNTFQDALWVVRKLGGRYIWIDSLCIIQDSETDWLVESASMCDVYSNSYCNICAAAARDGSEGMFRDREPLQVQQPWFQKASDEDTYCVIDRHAWIREVEDCMLFSRAWVCQERLLSRRNLHFGSRKLFWECLDHEASETFPRGIPQGLIESPIVKSEVKKLFDGIDKCQSDISFDGVKMWWKIVQLFMKCDLTFKTDRLVAIGGLANAASQKIGGKYLAGVWEKYLLYDILWIVTYHLSNTSKFTLAPIETQEFIAPSWSWASSDAEIAFLSSSIKRTEAIEPFLQILETHVDLAIDNPFGKVCGGYIKLKGDITSVTCYHPKFSDSEYSKMECEMSFRRGGKELESFVSEKIYSDFEDMREIDGQEVYLLPVCRLPSWYYTWEVRALILFPTNRARWEFRRCGVSIYSTNEVHEDLMSECTSFSRGEKYESSEFGRQDDGKFIIKIF